MSKIAAVFLVVLAAAAIAVIAIAPGWLESVDPVEPTSGSDGAH